MLLWQLLQLNLYFPDNQVFKKPLDSIFAGPSVVRVLLTLAHDLLIDAADRVMVIFRVLRFYFEGVPQDMVTFLLEFIFLSFHLLELEDAK